MIAWIQKYIIYLLVGAVVLLLIIAGLQTLRVSWKQTKIEKQEGTITLMEIDAKAKEKIIFFHEKEIKDNIQMRKNQQDIINQMAKKFSEIEKIDNQTKCMGVEDEKYLFKLYTDFNDFINGVSQTDNKSTDTKEVR